MNWLQFTDFHTGKPCGPQEIALTSLVETVRELCTKQRVSIDAVFITGDIAHSGNEQEYIDFADRFLLPLKNMPFMQNAKIFAAPGNHDVDCDIGLPISWNGIGKRNQTNFFYENDDGRKVRISRSKVFTAYWEFVQEYGIISPNPASEVTLIYDEKDLPFTLAICNTAYFADREFESGLNSTPSPLPSLRQLLTKRSYDKAFLVLSHHPVECLLKEDQKQFKSFLKDKRAFLIHGHLHEPCATFNSDGTLSTLGFGAAYIAPLEDGEDSQYRNSFALCSLEESLQIQCVSWDPFQGTWADTTSTDLKECYPPGAICTGLPNVSLPHQGKLPQSRANIPLASIPRVAPIPIQVIPLRALGVEVLKRIVGVSENLRKAFQKDQPTIRHDAQKDGKIKFEIELQDGTRHMVLLIVAVNHVLSSKEVESLNTIVDTEGFESVTIISLGRISDDGQRMYMRLRTRKSIEILVNKDLAASSNNMLSSSQRAALESLDAASNTVSIILSNNETLLLVLVRRYSEKEFYVLDAYGKRVSATESLITDIRGGNPEIAAMKYQGDESPLHVDRMDLFNESEYLDRCIKEYNVVKYAALANVGMRFSDLPLEDLYVSASASEAAEETSNRYEQIVSDHLESYPLSSELKRHIQEQLLNDVACKNSQEVSMATEFYQKYGALLVVGDPGSGKTCFVKNEMLTYARSRLACMNAESNSVSDWHSYHIPVMVLLSELVAEPNLEEQGLLPAVAALLERKGFGFPLSQMEEKASQGKIAFFFDGLDEVVSIEKRALVVQHINSLMSEFLQYGNRVIVTSRPAAVQLVNLLPTLHKLELQGLSPSQIEALAKRVLSIKLADTPEGVVLDRKELARADKVLVSQLMEDCSKNPGVARLAQNPLLLTLLIIVYANSGAPAAKRHRIYEEAIRTLASVRGHEAGHAPISTQDLRERLGAIALAVYKKESGLLPSRQEVREIVRNVMQRQRNEAVTNADADLFIQKVAESTGLIVIETRDGANAGDAIVTFMHHSFLEYFAAIGLSKNLSGSNLGSLVNEPRWAEILTLLAGIIGENEDVAPVLEQFLLSGAEKYDVDSKTLVFAMDCALECEVPSEAAQRLLAKNIVSCILQGPGRLDPWVRAEVGQRLGYLIQACGAKEFEAPIVQLLEDGENDVCAAAVDLIGHACTKECESARILRAFTLTCGRTDDQVLAAVCIASCRTSKLQNDTTRQVIGKCLKKSKRCKNAAFEALCKLPELANHHWTEIINAIDDSDAYTGRLASKAAIQAGLNANLIALSASRKDLLLRALSNVNDKLGRTDSLHNRVEKNTLDQLLGSALKIERILGIRLLPLADNEIGKIYGGLMQVLSSEHDREEIVAALYALAWCTQSHALISRDDLKKIIAWLGNGTTDVRIAATRLLSEFPTDSMAVQALLSRNFGAMDTKEYCEAIRSLSNTKVFVDDASTLIFDDLKKILRTDKKMSPENTKRVSSLLDAARDIGRTAPKGLSQTVREAITDFRRSDKIRRKALLCYPAISLITRNVIEDITSLYRKLPAGMEIELAEVPSIVAKKCRESVDSVVSCVAALPAYKDTLLSMHSSLAKHSPSTHLEFCITELRNGINEINQIINAFEDFIEKDGQEVKA